jgi:SH3-like domain-containing protein
MMKSLFVTLLAVVMSWSSICMAQVESEESETGLSLPRMVSLRSNRINARSGPGSRYPIEWVYQQKGAPVEIIAEFEFWRQIKDWEGSEVWVHKNMLSGRRFIRVINPGENNLYSKPDLESRVVAHVEDGVVGEVEKCPENSDMCLINFDNVQGWMPRSVMFGVYDDEVIK